jgi:peptidoglycan L-alanyl-D-glutamate endopeptidase CwlK
MKLDTLDPGFKPKAVNLIARLRQLAINVLPVQCRRTIAEQNGLYAKGRTAPGAKVTNAKGGQSPHNFGMAVDLYPVGKNGQLWWNAPDSVWRFMAGQARIAGLVPGYYFKSIHDPPHVEDPGWRTIQKLWRAGKIKIA